MQSRSLGLCFSKACCPFDEIIMSHLFSVLSLILYIEQYQDYLACLLWPNSTFRDCSPFCVAALDPQSWDAFALENTLKELLAARFFNMMRLQLFLLSLLECCWVLGSPMQGGFDSAYTSTDPVDLQRTYQVRLGALACSSVSVVACLVAFYWFCRMEKRFRHR